MDITIDLNRSVLKGNKKILYFMNAIEVFVESLPEESTVRLTDVEFEYLKEEE